MSELPESLGPLDAPVERASAVRWRIVGLMMAASFLSWFNRVSMSVAGTERVMEEYHISPTRMGFVYSALLLSYAACMTPGGWLIDRRGAWAALALMGFGSALCVALTGSVGLVFAGGTAVWLALLVVRAATGVCMAPIYPGCGRIIARWLPPRQRALANGLVNGAAPVGIACTFVGFGTLIDLFDWPVAFLVTAALTALLALVWWGYATEDPARHPNVNNAELQLIRDRLLSAPTAPAAPHSTSWWTWMGLLRNRSLVLLTISYAALGYFEYLFYFWTEYYFRDVRHLSGETSRLYAAVLNLSMGGGMMLGGLISDRLLHVWGRRWGRAAVPIAGMLLSAALLGLGLTLDDPLALVVCFAVALAAGGACEGPCWATAIELGGRRAGTSAGIFNTGGNVGGLLAPVVTPWVSGLFGWQCGLALGAVACLLGVGLWLGIDPRERPPGEEDDGRFKAGDSPVKL
ncbi:MAG TPA: MFS transporter [Gemmataceae bacterium]|jgi:ACS family glucarate transporter-like MFS transporter